MTLFDQLLRCADLWLGRLDHERDLVTRLLNREGAKPHLLKWIDDLDAERVKHLSLMTQLQALAKARHPALLLTRRPVCMMKAQLRDTRDSIRKGASA